MVSGSVEAWASLGTGGGSGGGEADFSGGGGPRWGNKLRARLHAPSPTRPTQRVAPRARGRRRAPRPEPRQRRVPRRSCARSSRQTFSGCDSFLSQGETRSRFFVSRYSCMQLGAHPSPSPLPTSSASATTALHAHSSPLSHHSTRACPPSTPSSPAGPVICYEPIVFGLQRDSFELPVARQALQDWPNEENEKDSENESDGTRRTRRRAQTRQSGRRERLELKGLSIDCCQQHLSLPKCLGLSLP